jgi:transketolase
MTATPDTAAGAAPPAAPGGDAAELARRIRAHALRMVHRARSSHIGTCLSMADVLAVLYARVLRVDPANPAHPQRDRFILSKGHGAAILYGVLAERGFIPVESLETYCEPGSLLLGHASHYVAGVELSTGSLGHGLPVACGMALAGKREGRPWRVYALLSDGELDEGSNWEAILFAAHHRLDNLVAVVDYNRIQSFGSVEDVLGLEPLADKWRAFGWRVVESGGHDHAALEEALRPVAGAPTVVIAHTTKGKGVGFMEGELAWHYKSPSDEQLADALAQVEAAR